MKKIAVYRIYGKVAVITAIAYSLLAVSHVVLEYVAFTLPLIVALAIGLWTCRGGRLSRLLLSCHRHDCRSGRHGAAVLITS